MIYTHGFSTKKDGDMRQVENVLRFLSSQQVQYQAIVRPKQTHSDHIHVIDRIPDETIHTVFDCDGVITSYPHLVLTVITADCVPVVFMDKKHGIIGICHAGWKGTYARLAQNMVVCMESVGGQKEHISVVFGPSISGNCYTISRERYEMFAAEFPSFFANETVKNSSDFTIDLQKLNIHQLREEGIAVQNITQSDLCTKEEDDLFSFRSDSAEHFGEIVTYVVKEA